MKQPSIQMGVIYKFTLCYCVVSMIQCAVASPVGQVILDEPIRRDCPYPILVSIFKSTLITSIGTGSRNKRNLDQHIKLDLFKKTVSFTPSNIYAEQLSGILHDYDKKLSAYKVGTKCLIRALPSNIASISDFKMMLDDKAQPVTMPHPAAIVIIRHSAARERPEKRYNLEFKRVNNSYSVPLRHQATPPTTYSSNIKQFCGESRMYQMDASLYPSDAEHPVRTRRSTSTSGSSGWDACAVIIMWEHREMYACESLRHYDVPHQRYGLCLLVDSWVF